MRYLKYLVLVTIVGAAVTWYLKVDGESVEPQYTISRTMKFSFTVENPTNRFLETARFWAYAPLEKTGFQRVKAITASAPYLVEVDEVGNRRLMFSVEKLPPYGSRTVSVTVDMGFREQPAEDKNASIERYLQAERFIESTDSRIQKIAIENKGKNSWASAENAYHWVKDYLREEGYSEQDRGALYALETESGDCTESAYLFAALSRANNIPARIMAGYVYAGSAVIQSRDYHNWAEVYIDGAWWIIDPNKGHYKTQQSQYLATKIIYDGENETSKSQEYFGADDNVRVTMN